MATLTLGLEKPNSFTIEHILPESTNNNVVGMLGNLLPLGEQLNSNLQDKSFKVKLSGYNMHYSQGSGHKL